MQKQNNKGFTLIELSIVLIIIGLIIGGILAGQELIKSAEARGVMGQLDRYNSAINAFKLKYSALPGDFAQASTMIPGAPTSGNGDGSVSIAVASLTATTAKQWNIEHLLFWQHLSAIGVIEGNFSGSFTGGVVIGTQIPSLKSNRGGLAVYGSTDGNNYYHLGILSAAAAASTSDMSLGGVMLPDTAYAIDSKIDDGVPNTGRINSVTAIDTLMTTGFGTGTCVSSAAAYNLVNNPGFICQLRYKLQ